MVGTNLYSLQALDFGTINTIPLHFSTDAGLAITICVAKCITTYQNSVQYDSATRRSV